MVRLNFRHGSKSKQRKSREHVTTAHTYLLSDQRALSVYGREHPLSFSNRVIIVADHHPLFRSECSKILGDAGKGALIVEADTVANTLKVAGEHDSVHLILLGLSLTDTDNFSGVRKLKQKFPDLKVAVVSSKHDPDVVERAMQSGAFGFIPKTLQVEEFKGAVSCLLSGKNWIPNPSYLKAHTARQLTQCKMKDDIDLTPTQKKVLMGLNRGLLNKHIADELGMAESTVKFHVSKLIKKFKVNSRTQVVIAASRLEFGCVE